MRRKNSASTTRSRDAIGQAIHDRSRLLVTHPGPVETFRKPIHVSLAGMLAGGLPAVRGMTHSHRGTRRPLANEVAALRRRFLLAGLAGFTTCSLAIRSTPPREAARPLRRVAARTVAIGKEPSAIWQRSTPFSLAIRGTVGSASNRTAAAMAETGRMRMTLDLACGWAREVSRLSVNGLCENA